MLRFDKHRTAPRPRQYLARREQYRLLAMVAALGLVALVAARIRSPAGHALLGSLFGQTAVAGDGVAEERVTLEDSRRWLSQDQAEEIRDNTVFRNAETEAWFAVLGKLKDGSPNRADAVPVGYAQLARQPGAYRGRSVAIAGHIMRIESQDPAKNDIGLSQYWRVIFRPQGDEVWPIAVYSLELPEGIEPGNELSIPASATGVFFKNLSYKSASGMGVMPVLLARSFTIDIPPQQDTPPESPPIRDADLWSIVGIAAGIAAVVLFVVFRGQGA